MLASLGQLAYAPIVFEPALDVPQAGVLLAVPALLLQGLLRHRAKYHALPAGYYSPETLFLVLAFLALARCRSLEQTRYESPGEWGKLVGLDRIPEVRTLRTKLGQLCASPGQAAGWSGELAREWMADQGDRAGVYYADGHVRVYHGSLTELPRRYVSRERLCLRGVTDYWVNALAGQPFFVVSQAVTAGLIAALRTHVIPRLKAEAPGQPSAAALAADPLLIRWVLVFDREGFSPDFFAELAAERIAVLTYHKYPGPPWPEEEFVAQPVSLANGETTSMALAERGTQLSNGLWMREVRRRTETGHQTAILTTSWRTPMTTVAPWMFGRWSQENFFRYMTEHYGLDQLAEYGTEPLPETTTVVNPAWRQADRQVRQYQVRLTKNQAAFGQLSLEQPLEPNGVEAFMQQKSALQQTVEEQQQQLQELKRQRQQTPHHLALKELPEAQRFQQLKTEKKHFVDTIKLIAYRAETAMASVVREKLARAEDARSLLRQLYQTAGDLHPDEAAKTLTVRLHHQTSALQDLALAHLCEEINATETIFPGTNLRLVFQLSGSG